MTVDLHICFAWVKDRKVAKLPCKKDFIAGIGVGSSEAAVWSGKGEGQKLQDVVNKAQVPEPLVWI